MASDSITEMELDRLLRAADLSELDADAVLVLQSLLRPLLHEVRHLRIEARQLCQMLAASVRLDGSFVEAATLERRADMLKEMLNAH